MQPTSIILAVAYFSAKTFAQTAEDSFTTFLQDPDVSSALAQLPSSVASQIASVAPILAEDIDKYVSSLVNEPNFATAVSELDPVLPDDAKSQLANDPHGFVDNLITISTPPSWADAIPTPVLGYFESIDSDLNSISSNVFNLPPLPLPTRTTNLVPRPGSSGTTIVPITSTTAVVTSPASTVTKVPAGSGMLPSGGIGSGSTTGRVVTPTNPSSPSVSQFAANSASRWNSMIGAVAALMAVGVGAILLA